MIIDNDKLYSTPLMLTPEEMGRRGGESTDRVINKKCCKFT